MIDLFATVQEEAEHFYRFNRLPGLLPVFIFSYLTYHFALGVLIVILPSIIT